MAEVLREYLPSEANDVKDDKSDLILVPTDDLPIFRMLIHISHTSSIS